MAAYPLSSFHEAMRTLLGDGGDVTAGYDFVDAQLDGALRTAVRMGAVPGLALVSGANPAELVAEPANPDTWGYLVAKAVWMMVGGTVDESVKTRAISVRIDPASRRNAVAFLDNMIADLDARGNVGGTASDTGHKGLFASQDDVMTLIGFCPPPDFPNPLIS